MAVRDDFTPGEKLKAADLNDTFASKIDGSWNLVTNGSAVLSGTAVTFTGLDDYNELTFFVERAKNSAGTATLQWRINNDGTAVVAETGHYLYKTTNSMAGDLTQMREAFATESAGLGTINFGRALVAGLQFSGRTNIQNCKSTTWKLFDTNSAIFIAAGSAPTSYATNLTGAYLGGAAVSSVSFEITAGTFTGGTIWVFGR